MHPFASRQRSPIGKIVAREPSRDQDGFPWFSETTDRRNDIHLSLDEKRAAQERRKK